MCMLRVPTQLARQLSPAQHLMLALQAAPVVVLLMPALALLRLRQGLQQRLTRSWMTFMLTWGPPSLRQMGQPTPLSGGRWVVMTTVRGEGGDRCSAPGNGHAMRCRAVQLFLSCLTYSCPPYCLLVFGTCIPGMELFPLTLGPHPTVGFPPLLLLLLQMRAMMSTAAAGAGESTAASAATRDARSGAQRGVLPACLL